MNYPKTAIMDESGLIISPEQAARALKIPTSTLRGRLFRWRECYPNADIAHLDRLRVTYNMVTVVHEGVVKEIPLVELVQLCGVSRPTVMRYLDAYKLQHPNMPVALKPFILRLQRGKGRGRPLKRTRTRTGSRD